MPRYKDEELVKEGELEFNRFGKNGRSLGDKRKKIAENGNEKALIYHSAIGNFEENEFCKILPNEFWLLALR